MKLLALALLLFSVNGLADQTVPVSGAQASVIISQLHRVHAVVVNGEIAAQNVYCAMSTVREGTEDCKLDIQTRMGPEMVHIFDPSKPHIELLQVLFAVPGAMPADDPDAHEYRGWSWPSLTCNVDSQTCVLQRD